MSDRPHSLLVTHYTLPRVSTWGHSINGYAPGCLACQEGTLPPCWCGGNVGPREPGDALGLGCLTDITHNWHGTDCTYTTSSADYCHTHDGHLASPSGECDRRDA